MKITVVLKLLPTPDQAAHLRATMVAVNAAATVAARVGFEVKTFNLCNLHKLVYRRLREEFGLPAQHAIKAIAKALHVFNRDKKACPAFRPDGAVPFDQRILSYRDGAISLATVGGRLHIPFVCGDHQKARLANGVRREAKLVLRNSTFYLHQVVELPDPPVAEATGWLGVDLGIANVATASDGTTASGDRVKKVRARYARRRAALQRAGTRSAKRRLRQRAGRESRFQRDVNHVVAKHLVCRAKALGLGVSVEDLTGLRRRAEKTVKPLRKVVGGWAFAQLRFFLAYKAALAGVPFRVVDPAFTSVTCSGCGRRDKDSRPDRDTFRCVGCGLALPADLNAARNIGATSTALRDACRKKPDRPSKPPALAVGR